MSLDDIEVQLPSLNKLQSEEPPELAAIQIEVHRMRQRANTHAIKSSPPISFDEKHLNR